MKRVHNNLSERDQYFGASVLLSKVHNFAKEAVFVNAASRIEFTTALPAFSPLLPPGSLDDRPPVAVQELLDTKHLGQPHVPRLSTQRFTGAIDAALVNTAKDGAHGPADLQMVGISSKAQAK